MTVSGQGKLLLFGEHAAVQGHPAVGVGLPLKTSLSYQPTAGGDWVISGVPDKYQDLVRQLLRTMKELTPGSSLTPGDLTITSNVPIGSGFGSSSALCAALARLFAPEASFPLLWQRANEAEKVFHGRPSGIDTGLALLGRLTAFSPQAPALPQATELPGLSLSLVAGSVPRAATTKSLVTDLAARVTAGERAATEVLKELGRLARRAIDVLTLPPSPHLHALVRLGQLMTDAQSLLAALGLSTPGLADLFRAGREAGALGAKLSGAGGGGAFYLLAASPEHALHLRDSLRQALLPSDFLHLPTIYDLKNGQLTTRKEN